MSPKHQPAQCHDPQAASNFHHCLYLFKGTHVVIRAEFMPSPKRFSSIDGCEAVMRPMITLLQYRRPRQSSLKDRAVLLLGRSGRIQLVEGTKVCNSLPNCLPRVTFKGRIPSKLNPVTREIV